MDNKIAIYIVVLVSIFGYLFREEQEEQGTSIVLDIVPRIDGRPVIFTVPTSGGTGEGKEEVHVFYDK